MDFELHLTVETTDIAKFQSDCRSIGVKPVIIEAENQGVFLYQLLTSSKHWAGHYRMTLDYTVHEMQLMGYKVIRQKVEIQPEVNKLGVGVMHPEHVYYETHMRLKIPRDFDIAPLKEKLKDNKFWHFSRNVFKDTDTHYYQMLTYRDKKLDLDPFKHNINLMKLILDLEGVEYDKIEIEECIYDTNESVDDTWLDKSGVITIEPTVQDIALHRAFHNTTGGIEPIYMNTFTRSTKAPENGGKITLEKNRYGGI